MVEINRHSVHIISFRFLRQQVDESLLLLLDVDRLGALAHAASRVCAESEEVAKDVGGLLLHLGSSFLKSSRINFGLGADVVPAGDGWGSG